MVDRVGFQVQGLAQLTRDLKGLGLDVEDLKEAFGQIATKGARVAAGLAPKRSGRLAASIRGNRAQSKAVVTAGRAVVRYAGPINYGWPARNIAASGFMQKTDELIRPVAVQLLETEINHRIQVRGLQ